MRQVCLQCQMDCWLQPNVWAYEIIKYVTKNDRPTTINSYKKPDGYGKRSVVKAWCLAGCEGIHERLAKHDNPAYGTFYDAYNDERSTSNGG